MQPFRPRVLQSGQSGAFLGQVCVHQIANAGFKRVLKLVDEADGAAQRLGLGAQGRQRRGDSRHDQIDVRRGEVGDRWRCRRELGQVGVGAEIGGDADRLGVGRAGTDTDVDRRTARGRRLQQVDPVEAGAVQRALDFLPQGRELVLVGRLRRAGGTGDPILRRASIRNR